jgi:hypothetical protein
MTDPRPVPLLGDISLEFVQQIEHTLAGGFVATRIAGLAGELQQRSGRPSHRVHLTGVLFGADATDQLKTLQNAATNGEELTFSADITKALDLQRVVITSFRVVEVAGQPDRFLYELSLAESPPLPPPAELSPFGGLGDFGLGDLGFDTSLLDDLQNVAGDIAGAVDAALDVVDQLSALANLDGLNLGGFLEPMNSAVNEVSSLGTRLNEAARSISQEF